MGAVHLEAVVGHGVGDEAGLDLDAPDRGAFLSEQVLVAQPINAVLGVGSGAIFLSTWAMIPDTVEFGEWKTGIRAEGATFGFVSFVQKASLGFAAGLLGEVLSVIGYTANMAQTPETLASLKIVMLAVPTLFASLAAVTILFYSLDTKLHGRLVRALRWRRLRKNVDRSRPIC